MPSREQWTASIRAMDPFRELHTAEVPVLYADRPEPAWKRIWDGIDYAPNPSATKVLLAGSRGSGKTTELVKLQTCAHERFVVVRLDIAPVHEDGAGTLPIVAAVGAALELANRSWRAEDAAHTSSKGAMVKAMGGFGVAAEAFEGLLTPLGSLLSMIPEPHMAAAGVAMVTAGTFGRLTQKAIVQLQGLSRGDKLQGPVDANSEQAATELIEAVNAALEELTQLAGRAPMLLIDGLDKKTNIDHVMIALHDVRLLLSVRAPIVFTGPAHLRTDERFAAGNVVGFQAEVLHNVTVLDHGDTSGGRRELGPHEPGISALRSLALKRLGDANVPTDLVPEACIDRLAQLSSGCVRDFLRLLDEAGKACRGRVGQSIELVDVEQAIRVVRHGFEGAINEQDIQLLAKVLKTERLPAGERADALFFENHIACFRNYDLLYRPHEVLVDYIRRASA